MQPDVYQWPSMFRTIHRVYSRLSPGAPNGTSGQLPGPSLFVNSTWAPLFASSSSVIVAVAGQFATSGGEFMIVACLRSTASFDDGPLGDGGGGGAGVGGGGGAGVDGAGVALRRTSVP